MSNLEYDEPDYPEFYVATSFRLTFSHLYEDWVANSPLALAQECSSLNAPNAWGNLFSGYENDNYFSDYILVYRMEKEAEYASSLIEGIEGRRTCLSQDSHENLLLELLVKWLYLYRQVTVEWRAIGIQESEGGTTSKGVKDFNFGLESIIKGLKSLSEELKIQINKEVKPQLSGVIVIPTATKFKHQEEKLQGYKEQETEVITWGIERLEEICFFNETCLLIALPLHEKIKSIQNKIKSIKDKIEKNKSELSQKWLDWRERFKIVAKACLFGMVLGLISNEFISIIIEVAIILGGLVVTLQLIELIFFSITIAYKNKTLSSEIPPKTKSISQLYHDIQEIKNNWISSAKLNRLKGLPVNFSFI